MKFTGTREDLLAAATWAGRAAAVRPTVPVTAGIKLTLTGTELVMSAFDFEQSAAFRVNVDTDPASEDGVTLVSGKLFQEIIKSLPASSVTLEQEGAQLAIRSGSAKFWLPVMKLDDYPEMPVVPAGKVTVSGPAFAEAVRRVTVASAKDDSLPMLQGIQIVIDPAEQTLTLTATDRYRLATITIPVLAGEGDQETLLVPARTLDGYAKAIAKSERVTLGAGGASNILSLTDGTATATTRLIDSTFPQWRALFPDTFASTANFSRASLQESLKRVTLVNRTNPCRLAFEDGVVTVSAGTSDDGAADETLTAAYTGEPLSIAFNPVNLLDGLAALGDGSAVMSMQAGNKAAVLTSTGDDAYSYLIMPVRTA